MHPVIELIRLEETQHGTFGVLKVNKQVFCVTLEPKDAENQADISSIPAQQYLCRKVEHPRYGVTWRVMDVPGRTGILFHPGNTAADTSGCIILAQHFGKLEGNRAVLNSGATFKQFAGLLADHNFLHLTVKEEF